MIDFRDPDAHRTLPELLAPEPALVERIRAGLEQLRQQNRDENEIEARGKRE